MLEEGIHNSLNPQKELPVVYSRLKTSRINKPYLMVGTFLVLLIVAGLSVAAWASAPKRFIDLEDQPIENYLLVKKAVLSESGFVVVRASKYFTEIDLNRPVLAHSRLTSKGSYQDVVMFIGELNENAEDIIGELKVGDEIRATIHIDNGDGVFDENLDPLAVTLFNRVIQDKAVLI